MLTRCVARRFAITLALATLWHALSGTQGFHCIVVFTHDLWNRICEHLFSYSSDYSVVMSSACSFLALMKLIGDSCLSKKSVWQPALLNPEPVS